VQRAELGPDVGVSQRDVCADPESNGAAKLLRKDRVDKRKPIIDTKEDEQRKEAETPDPI
jgi:hypothetical protein